MHHLPEEEQIRVAAQVDYFVEVLSKRYGVTPQEVLNAVRWVNEHQKYTEKLKYSALLSLIGITVSALLFVLWEGIKHAVAQIKGP